MHWLQMHRFSGVRTMEKMLVQSLSTTCRRCRHHSVLQTTAAGYNCCYQPTVACFMRASSFHLIGSVLNIINCSKSQLFSINQSRPVTELPILHPPGCLDWCLTAQSAHPHHSTAVRVGDDSCPRTLYFVEDNSLCGSM